MLDACEKLGASLPRLAPTGIHRDFYADNILVDGPRLCLLDLDLYCGGGPDRLSSDERALDGRFVEITGERVRPAARAYTTLTLVRHIHISTLFVQRRHTTGPLLGLSEERPAGGYRLPLDHNARSHVPRSRHALYRHRQQEAGAATAERITPPVLSTLPPADRRAAPQPRTPALGSPDPAAHFVE